MSKEKNKIFDVVIVGCGIGGMFAAYELMKKGLEKILIIEKGQDIYNRFCPRGNKCCSKECCSVLCGVGGAGGFSDGKVTLSPRIGVHYENLLSLSKQIISAHIEYVHQVIREFVQNGIYYGEALRNHEVERSFKIEGYKGYHIGTDGIRIFVEKLYNVISRRCKILLQSEVIDILHLGKNNIYRVTYNNPNGTTKTVLGKYIILSTGLESPVFNERVFKKLGIPLQLRESDIGVRLETHQNVFSDLMNNLYDFKIYYNRSGVNLRTFCVNHRGYVLTENHKSLGISGVNGHSYLYKRTNNTNLGILATITFKESENPVKFVRDLARAINHNGQGYPLYQSLNEFLKINREIVKTKKIRRTNSKVRKGNIRELLPDFLYNAFNDFLQAIRDNFPEIEKYQSYLYAPEIKYFQYKVPLRFDTCIPQTGIYVIGNASGYTANLMGAAIMARIAAESIENKLGLKRGGQNVIS